MQKITTAEQDFQTFLEELPSDYQETAFSFKAFSRSRKVKNPVQLLRILFLYCGLDKSLREVAATHTLLHGISISDSSIHERLRSSLPWVKEMLSQMLGFNGLKEKEKYRFLIFDGSTVQGLKPKGTHYRIHFVIELLNLCFVDAKVTTKRVSEAVELYQVKEGDVVLGDRNYLRQSSLLKMKEAKADGIFRLNPFAVRLLDLEGENLQLVFCLKKQRTKKVVSIQTVIGGKNSPKTVQGVIHACRLPKKVADEKRRKLKRQYRKKGRKKHPSQASLYLCGWVLIFTTLCPKEWKAEVILEIYRLRWQVEISIKRLKSLLNLSELRLQEGSLMSEVWLNGKLLYVMILERKMRRRLSKEWLLLSEERVGTLWRPFKLIIENSHSVVNGCFYWNQNFWKEALEVLKERKRKRTLQTLPERMKSTILHLGQELSSLT
jgi:hypothetical protein